MDKRCSSRRAFTLLEILVATAMTAVLAGSLFATLHIAFKARRSAAEAVEIPQRAELAAEFVRRDVESAVVPDGVLAGPFIGEDRANEEGWPCDTLSFYAVSDAGRRAAVGGDIQLVEYSCGTFDGQSSMTLLRRETKNLLSARAEPTGEEILFQGMRSFNLRYFDGFSWSDSWDSSLRDNVLPAAVEATLVTLDGSNHDDDEEGYIVSKVIQVFCSTLAAGGS
jgi:prepilin-type N-terminal cleavage/methylation domain-containing protein